MIIYCILIQNNLSLLFILLPHFLFYSILYIINLQKIQVDFLIYNSSIFTIIQNNLKILLHHIL